MAQRSKWGESECSKFMWPEGIGRTMKGKNLRVEGTYGRRLGPGQNLEKEVKVW